MHQWGLNMTDLKEVLAAHGKWLRKEPGGARADLRWEDLTGQDLSGSDLRVADIKYAELRRANLSSSILRGASLIGADLRSAAMRNSDLRRAHMYGALLDGADLTSAVGNGREVKSIHIGRYDVVWTAKFVWIGCRMDTVEGWESLDEDELSIGDRGLWRTHGAWILETVRRFPADATEE